MRSRSAANGSWTVTVAMVVCLLASRASAELDRFDSWYPSYRDALKETIQTNCSVQYDNYLTGNDQFNASLSPPEFAIWTDGGHLTSSQLINCLLTAMPELMKSKMAATQVLLGLMPIILVSVGPSIQETAACLVHGKRPLLSLLLAIGAPVVSMERGFAHREYLEELKSSINWLTPVDFRTSVRLMIIMVEYATALGAIANNALLSYEIPFRSATSLASTQLYFPALWTFLGIVIRLIGAIALRLSLKIDKRAAKAAPQQSTSTNPSKWFQWPASLINEPHSRERLHVQLLPPSYLAVLLSWFTSLLAACNLIFGTIVFSSILFVAINDAIFIVLRYMASVVFCRAIVMYELSLMRKETSFTLESAESPVLEKRMTDSSEVVNGHTQPRKRHTGTFARSEVKEIH